MDFNLTLIGQTVAMIVFVWFCMKWIWPPVMVAIDKRRKQIADGIAAGEKGQKELADAHKGAEPWGHARNSPASRIGGSGGAPDDPEASAGKFGRFELGIRTRC